MVSDLSCWEYVRDTVLKEERTERKVDISGKYLYFDLHTNIDSDTEI